MALMRLFRPGVTNLFETESYFIGIEQGGLVYSISLLGRAMRKRKRGKSLSKQPTALWSAGAGSVGYWCDRLYLCSRITAYADSQSHFVHVGKSHPFPQAVAAVICQSHCANGARQLQWIESQRCLGRQGGQVGDGFFVRGHMQP